MAEPRNSKKHLLGVHFVVIGLCVCSHAQAQPALARALRPHVGLSLSRQAVTAQATPVATNITVDATLNPMLTGTIVPNSGTTTYSITPLYGRTSGPNEFFSFSTFNLGTGDTAQFQVPNTTPFNNNTTPGTTNIISRVTGGASTTIDGTVTTLVAGTTNPSSANFWFINPAGITIGQGAVLNVPAGLALGSADYINFAGGLPFYALPSNGPTLPLSPFNPTFFGFLPKTTAGELSITQLCLGCGTTPIPYIYLEGSSVNISDSNITATPPAGSSTGLPNILIAGETVSITGTIDTLGTTNIASPNGVIGIAAVPSLADLSILPVNKTTDFLFGNAAAPYTPTGVDLVNSFGSTLGAVTLTNAYVHSDGAAGGGGVYILGGQITVGGNLGKGPYTFVFPNIPSCNAAVCNANGADGLNASADYGSPDLTTTLGVHVYGQSLSLNGNNQIVSYTSGTGESGPINIQLTGDLTLDGTLDALITGNPNTAEYYGTGLLATADYGGSSESTSFAGGITVVADNMKLLGPANAPAPLAPGISGGPGVGVVDTVTYGASRGADIDITLAGDLDISGYRWAPLASGAGVAVGGGAISSETESIGAAGNITISAEDVDIHDGAQLQTLTVGGGAAGNVTINFSGYMNMDSVPPSNLGSNVFLSSGVFSLSEPPPSCSSCSPTGAPAGNVMITWMAPTAMPPTAAQPSAGYINISGSRILSDGSANEGQSGFVSISTPGQISITGSTIDTNVSSELVTPPAPPPGSPPPGSVSVTSTGSSVLVNGSTIETLTSGAANAGPVALSGATTVTVGASTIQTQSTGPNGTSGGGGSAGPVSIVGSGVLIANQTLVDANYNNAGGTSGTPGTILVQATGTNNNPAPQNSVNQANPGVVAIVNSMVTSQNTGGLGGIGGVILIGATPPTTFNVAVPPNSASTTDAVVISGSTVTNSVSAGGHGSPLVINGSQGVWINGTSSILSLTDATAASPGQIYILGGSNGVSVAQSVVDADNGFTAMNNGTPNNTTADIQITSTGGPVNLAGATVTAKTTGIDAGGNIGISGQTVSVMGGSISASSNPIADLADFSNFPGGNAGTISISATGADPSSTVSALRVGGGATISSAVDGVAATGTTAAVEAGNAGTIVLTANLGTVQVGVPSDSLSSPNVISTSAGTYAGQAGAVSLIGKSVSLTDTQLLTTVATRNTADASNVAYVPASVTLRGSGQVNLADTLIDTRTSGAVDAGSVTIKGDSVSISSGQAPLIFGGKLLPANTAVFSGTSNTGNAGSIDILALGLVNITNATISAQSGSTGNGGAISIVGNSIFIDPSTISTNTDSVGAAGTITITAFPGALTLEGATIESASSSKSTDAGAVGLISLTGGSVSLRDNSQILATSRGGRGTGGSTTTPNIEINAGGSPLWLQDSLISAEAFGNGNGGNVTISHAGPIILQGSEINAQANTGHGGNIHITQVSSQTPFVQDPASKVSASSTFGTNGTVTINGVQIPPNTTATVPDVSVAEKPELARNACRRDRNRSTLVREGRGGVATDPEGYLTSTAVGPTTEATSPASASLAQPVWLLGAVNTDKGCL